MKNSNKLISLASSLIAPAIAAWLLAGCEISADLFLGAYTLAGLFYLTTTDYLPRRALSARLAPRGPRAGWIQTSLQRTMTGNRRMQRTEKILA